MHIKINGFLLNKSLIKWNNPFLPEFAFARVFYYINGKGTRQLQLPKHRNVASEVKLGQVKNLMNFCKTSTRENRKARKVLKPTREPRITKAVLPPAFFPPAQTLTFTTVSNYWKTHQSRNFLEFIQGFCQKFLSKELQEGPFLSITNQEQPSSQFMRNGECENTSSTGCERGQCVSGQAGVTKGISLASFWMQKWKKKETKPAERQWWLPILSW